MTARPGGSAHHSIRGSRPAGARRAPRRTPVPRARRADAGQRREHPGHQLAPPGPHVDEGEPRPVARARASTRHSSRATAPANSGEACTDVRKCPAGPSGRVEAVRPVQGLLAATRTKRVIAPPSVATPRHSSASRAAQPESPPWGVRSRDRIGPPADPCTLPPVPTLGYVQRLYDFLRRHPTGSTASGLSSCSGSPACADRGSTRRRGTAAAGRRPGRPSACAWSSRCAAGRRRRCCCSPSAAGVAQLVARRQAERPRDFAMLVIIYTVAADGARWASRLALVGGLCAARRRAAALAARDRAAGWARTSSSSSS